MTAHAAEEVVTADDVDRAVDQASAGVVVREPWPERFQQALDDLLEGNSTRGQALAVGYQTVVGLTYGDL